MKLLLVGVDHTSASVEVRECLAFSPTDLPIALSKLVVRHNGTPPLLAEAVILSTCNRVEIYGVVNEQVSSAEDKLVEFLAEFHQLPKEQFAASLFVAKDEAVVRHLFETASGLRSIVLGEAQIQGQVRTAYATAQRVRSSGAILSRLFRSAISTGKRVRHETSIGAGAASVSQAGVELARNRLGSLNDRCVVLVGSGAVSELAAQNLLANGAGEMVVINRTYERGVELAARYGATALPFDQLTEAISRADIVISSTAAPTTIIHRSHIEEALRRRAARQAEPKQVSLLLIDLAVPRDIDAEVSTIPGVHLYTVDDLHEVVNQTLVQRSAALAAAQAIVNEEAEAFISWLNGYRAVPVLSTWREQADKLRHTELQRVMRKLRSLSPEDRHTLEAFSRSLVNKLLHHPTLRTKHAASQGEGKRYAEMLQDLWNIR